MKLSVVLAVKNEEENLGACLKSVKSIADEIIVVDDGSSDKSVAIAKENGASVFSFVHKNNFHETKQFAIDKAKGEWILQLDADERVNVNLANEIEKITHASDEEIETYQKTQFEKNIKLSKLFLRHQKLVFGHKNSPSDENGRYVAFFIPRINYFLGKPLIHAGVYPDGVIRLIKKGKARLPAKSVHELMKVDGKVGWLFNNLEHHDSPTLRRYFDRMNRYTDLQARDFEKSGLTVSYWNLFNYSFLVPSFNFLKLYLRHKGIMDGMGGFLWSIFSSLHFPLSYFKYWQSQNKK